MPETRRLIPRVSDKELLAFFNTAAEMLGSETYAVLEFGGAAATPWKTGATQSEDDFSDDFIHRIARIDLNAQRFKISVDRQTLDQGDAPLYDTLFFNNTASEANPVRPGVPQETIRSLQSLIASTFGKDDEKVAGLFRNPKLFRDLLASHHRQNVQLQQAVLSVGEQAAAARIALEQEFSRRRSNFDDDVKKDEAERAKAYQAKLDGLADKEKAVAEREKDLDDRSNTHARRELHRDLKTKIAQRSDSLRVTPETIANRRPIHVAVAASITGLFGVVIYLTAQTASISSQASLVQTLISAAKPLTLTVALLGLVAWYLRWMNRWFERYADAEFQLKQFDLDIDRASWVVEAALEWKLSQDRPMPEHLLETISRNLFAKGEKDEGADLHPADYLASAILGRASNVNLKVPGGEISLTGKDIGKLQKDTMQ